MTRSCGLLAALALLAIPTVAPGQEDLEIRSIQVAYGPFGPERKTLEFYPNDEIHVRFLVDGVELDEQGRSRGQFEVRLEHAEAGALFSQSFDFGGIVALGGRTAPAVVHLNLPANLPPGEGILHVQVEDQIGQTEASFHRDIRFKPAELAVVAPAFFYDQAGEVPAPAGGVVGQTLFFRARLIGFDKSRDRIDVEFSLQYYDEDGKPLMPEPLVSPVRADDAEQVQDANALTFTGTLALNRAGTFTMRLTAIDRISGKTTQFEAPLRVVEP